jgi:DNA polymerase III epsilon subunit-like protein
MAGRTRPDLWLQLRLPEPASERDTYAVFDLETTGLDPRSCLIIEIGWCVVRDGAAQPVRALLVRREHVPADVQALTGITPKMLRRDGVPLEAALRAFLDDTADLPLVGHNVLRFDAPFLEAACRSAGLPPPQSSRYRDTAALYKASRLGLHPRPGQDHRSFALAALDVRAPGLRYNLGACCRELGVAVDGTTAHRAAGDVAVTQRLYARLLGAG